MTEGRETLVSTKELERLHGRLVWFNAFVFGRTLKAAVGVISKFSRWSSSMVKVKGTLRDALVVLQAELAKDEPVFVREAVSMTWTRTVFTDGAYEPDGKVKASIGGVLVNEDGLVVECFGLELSDSLRQELGCTPNLTKTLKKFSGSVLLGQRCSKKRFDPSRRID